MTAHVVVIDAAPRAAYGSPPALPVGSFVQLANGQVLRVEDGGLLEQLHQGARPWGRSAASDPGASRSTVLPAAHLAGPRSAPARKPGRRGPAGIGEERPADPWGGP